MMVLAPSSGEIAPNGLGDADDEAHQAVVVVAEARGDEARMQAVGGDAGAGEPPRQLAGEQDVAELGRGIDAERRCSSSRLCRSSKSSLPRLVRVRRGRDDARARRAFSFGRAADWSPRNRPCG